jgi:hypothetical protein
MFVVVRRQLAALFDVLDSRPVHAWLERLTVVTATVGFLLHLLVVLAVRNLPGLPETALEGLDESLLHAVYTPFSVILFYEVLQLVFALAASHTGEIAKQYQIISLIVVRRVFKDIGSFENIEHWLAEPNAVRAVLLDMGGAVLMFLLVTAFVYLRRITPKVPIDRDLGGFIELKKAVAVFLLVVLVGLAAVNLGSWLGVVPTWLQIPTPAAGDFDIFFFPAFFEFMIFTDVFLLIVSLSYYDRYEYVFRNAGFVISTVLLRVSLSTPKPYDLGLALFAMAYGVVVLAVFACFSWIARRPG